MSKVIVVFGATGSQGGAVMKALLADPNYKVRAVTRTEAKAKDLQSQGAETVIASLDEPETLKKAFEGAYGAFVVTNFWEIFSMDREIAQGKAAVDAAKAAGVKHFIFSGLENVKDAIGKDCLHFDGKGKVEDYLKASGVPFTSLRYSFYYENLLYFLPPQKQSDGTFTITIPMGETPMDAVSVADMGVAVRSVFNDRDAYLGKFIGLSGDRLKIAEYADVISRVTGKTVKSVDLSIDVYSNLTFPGAAEMGAMFDFYIRGNPDRNIELTRKLNPKARTFEQWARDNKDGFLKVVT